MKTRTGFWVATVAATAAVGFSGTALADSWRHGRVHQQRQHHDEHRHHPHRQHHDHHNRIVVHQIQDDYARVIDVDPIVSRVRVSSPARECWNETQTSYSTPRSSVPASTIVGTVIGGAIGHRIGHRAGHGHDPLATVAGGLVGAVVGHGIGERRDERRGMAAVAIDRTVEHCNVNYADRWEEQVDGYRVTYVYHGRTYTTRMPYDPGRTLRVNVDIEPMWNGR